MAGNVYAVSGNTLRMDNNIYASDGNTIQMTQSNTSVVKGGSTFGTTTGLTEVAQTTTVLTGAGSGTTAVTKTYYDFGSDKTKIYGVVNNSTVAGFAISATMTFVPAEEWPTNPELNKPYTSSYVVNTQASGISTTANNTETRTFSVEQLTTLAGTFATCKVKTDLTSNGTTTTSYTWYVGAGPQKGHLLKTADANGVRTMEVTLLQVNGN
ncbi:MAG: hypothetical protein Fur007_24580 [Rhodoferax sp.]